MPDPVATTNGESSHRDLLALSDEQILEIEPEAQDVEISSAHPDASEFDDLVAAPGRERTSSRTDRTANLQTDAAGNNGSTSEAGRAAPWSAQDASAIDQNLAKQATGEASGTGHGTRDATPDPPAPPQWLADRMSDPQHGAEARELWNTSQLARGSEQARQEAAAFREVFAKPEDARAAAQRARVLDDIDRAYFAGDTTQRATLAASLLREDPAAFREMVFAGLRALEQAGQSTSSWNPANDPARAPATAPVARAFRPEGLDANGANATTTSNPGPQIPANTGTQPPDRNTLTPEGMSYNPGTDAARISTAINAAANASHPSPVTNHQHLAAYSAFERGANEDLERSVGALIERTLDQALPNARHSDSAAMKSRLAAGIRQDVERALQGDRQLGEQVAQILNARRFDDEARASVVRLIGERAQQLVPGAARRVLSEWTQTTLAAHRSQRDRTDATATRREVDPASAAASGATPRAAATAASSQRGSQQGAQRQQASTAARSPRNLDYRRLSDEQILDL